MTQIEPGRNRRRHFTASIAEERFISISAPDVAGGHVEIPDGIARCVGKKTESLLFHRVASDFSFGDVTGDPNDSRAAQWRDRGGKPRRTISNLQLVFDVSCPAFHERTPNGRNEQFSLGFGKNFADPPADELFWSSEVLGTGRNDLEKGSLFIQNHDPVVNGREQRAHPRLRFTRSSEPGTQTKSQRSGTDPFEGMYRQVRKAGVRIHLQTGGRHDDGKDGGTPSTSIGCEHDTTRKKQRMNRRSKAWQK